MNYFDLVDEGSRRVGADDFTSRADDIINRAWRYMGRRLRTLDQITFMAATTSPEGTIALPEDFLENHLMHLDVREDTSVPFVVSRGAFGEPIPFVPDAGVLHSFAVHPGYSIVGDNVLVDRADTSVIFQYFANLPVPSGDNPQPTLLRKEQDLCVSAVVYQGAVTFGKVELATTMRTYVDDVIEDVQANADRVRFMGATIEKQLGPTFNVRHSV